MYDLTTELAYPQQCRLEVVHLEVRQGMRIAWSVAPLVHAERRGTVCRLPALALSTCSVDELDT
jgi:hypothetical protein